MTNTPSYDLIVIGGGPAGSTAALRACELGASVALIERGAMGGTCTNDGCVPTRVLARAARLMALAGQYADYGMGVARPELDFQRLLARSQAIVYEIHEKKQLSHLHRHPGSGRPARRGRTGRPAAGAGVAGAGAKAWRMGAAGSGSRLIDHDPVPIADFELDAWQRGQPTR